MWSTHDGINALRRESRELASSLPAAMRRNQQGGSRLNPVMLAPLSRTSASRAVRNRCLWFMTPFWWYSYYNSSNWLGQGEILKGLPEKCLRAGSWRRTGTSVQRREFSSVQFSRSVVSDSLRPHELQHTRPPCPSPTPRVHSNSCPSSQWCHLAISSSIVPFSSCPQSLPATESFPISQLFAWGGQSTGVSASASFLPKKSQGWSPSEWTGWISL